MKIALFPSAFAPHFGGVEELTRQLGIQLIREGHNVIVLTNRWPRSLPKSEQVDGIQVYRPAFRAPDAGAKSRLTYALTNRLVCREVEALLVKHQVDVMHVQCVSANAHYALEARRRLGLPLIVTFQGELTMDASGLFQRSEFARTTLFRCAAEAEVITGCSAKTLADADAFLGGRLRRSRVVFNAANTEEFAAAQPHQHPRPYILAIGRLVPQKGFDVLLQAFALSGIRSQDLVLAGDGPELQSLRKLAAELGIVQRVCFTGRADRTKVPALFAGCAFFVLPSTADEGLPVVCAEAMAAGKAVVATRSGGAPEAVLDGETGLLVDRADVGGLSEALGRLSREETLRAEMGAAGSRRAALFSWSAVTREYLTCYHDAVRSSRESGSGERQAIPT